MLSVFLAAATNTGPSNQSFETDLANTSSLPIDQLIEQLGAPSYTERETASSQLVQIGLPTKEALYLACKHSDLEIRVRARRALHDMWQRYAFTFSKDFLAGSSLDDQTPRVQDGPFNKDNRAIYLLEVSGFVSGMSEIISSRIEVFAADPQKPPTGFPQRDRMLLQQLNEGIIRQEIYAGIEPAAINAIRSLGGITIRHDGRTSFLHAIALKSPKCDQIAALFCALQGLKTVKMPGSPVSDTWLAQLDQLPHLEVLYVESDRITNTGVSHIGKNLNLNILGLASSQVTDQGISYLVHLKELRTLYINTPQITNDGILHLKTLPNLKYLTICNCQLTDTGFLQLCQIKSLRNMHLFGTQVTSAVLNEASTAYPHISIYLSQRPPANLSSRSLLDR